MFKVNYNGTDLPIRVKSVSGRGPIEQNVTWQERLNTDGSRLVNKKFPMRGLDIEFKLDAANKEDLRNKVDELNEILYTSGDDLVPVIFSDEPDFTYYAILDGSPSWDEIAGIGIGNIPLMREPFKEGAEVEITVGSGNLTNNGLLDVSPIITNTFTSAATEFNIKHVQSGKYVRVIWNFVAGDVLVIDLKRRRVTINGNVRMTAYDWKSSPFKLVKGTNSFTVTPTAGTTKIKFRPRWA